MTHDEQTVDRVAFSIWNATKGEFDTWQGASEGKRDQARRQARAALSAMATQEVSVQEEARDDAYAHAEKNARHHVEGYGIMHTWTCKSAFNLGWEAALRALSEGKA